MLREGQLDEREIEIEVRALPMGVEIMAPAGMEDLTQQLQSMFSNLGGTRTRTRKVKVREAFKLLTDEEAAKMINEEELKLRALANAEQNGIVFIDEIDKIARRQETHGADVSREGVQRDLLPLVEGSTVSTKYGMVKTDHILFIASGAFHMSKPSDLIPELQGRFPIRVELDALKVEDFIRILTEPDASLCTQYRALLETEGVKLEFAESGVRRIAEVAFQVNERTENIGARRLHTVLERLLEALSYEAADRNGLQRHRRREVRRRAPRRAGEGRRPDPLHPVGRASTRLFSMPHPTSIKARTRSRLLEVIVRRRLALRAAVRIPARLLAVGRSARPRPGSGDVAAGQARSRRARRRAGRQLCRAPRLRRRPRHRPVHLGVPARARQRPRGEMAAIPGSAAGAGHSVPDACRRSPTPASGKARYS